METKFRPVMTIRIFADEKCFGPGIARLLHRVEELHSLRAAASSMDMAYSKAWTILRASQQALGFPLLESTTGGKNGGGAVLTEQAKKLLTEYDAYCRDLEAYAEHQFAERFENVF
ncbi:MAG: LysR family transcriptional regulator [Clostridia bacterium]|nr:LysR family transcriptional regulator [Clostridia bacterium]